MTDTYSLPLSEWEIVNDDVMGGISRSSVRRADTGWQFSGEISLENNGGFASARSPLDALDVSAYTAVRLQLLGDGKRYGFNVRSVGMRRLSYRAYFDTTGKAQMLEIALCDLQPTSFGEVVPDAPPLDLSHVGMVGFIIADGQAGTFSLEVRAVEFIAPAG